MATEWNDFKIWKRGKLDARLDISLVTLDASLVKSAISTILSVQSSQEERREAHELLETFKQTSPWCASSGIALYSSHENDPSVRHIGLQLVQDYVKLKWDKLSSEEKENLKAQVIELIVTADFDDPGHIKEALARLLVELVKREWPWKWTNLFLDLGNIQAVGEAPLELVLLILLRLAEDVTVFDSKLRPTQKRNMMQSLNTNMGNLFQFFVITLRTQYELWKKNAVAVNQRLAEATLFAFTGYLDWANLEYVFAENSVLLQMFCILLEDSMLRLPACECLVILLERKGKAELRAQFLVLFIDAMDVFVETTRKAFLVGVDKDEYQFLKKMCQLLVNLGVNQLAFIWGDDKGTNTRPQNFDKYLKLILDFTSHQSLMLCSEASTVWTTFLRHEHISKDDVFIEMLPQLLQSLLPKLAKFPNPTKDDHSSCDYSSLDFDSPDELHRFFGKVRGFVIIIIRECTVALPDEAFQQTYKYILEIVQSQNIENVKTEDADDDLSSVELLKWEALTYFTEAVMGQFFKSENVVKGDDTIQHLGKSVNVVNDSNEIIKMLIECKPKLKHALISILSCIQAMFPSLKLSSDNLLSIIEKIFLILKDDQPQFHNKDTLQLRRHTTACFLNLCKEEPGMLAQHFDDLETGILTLANDEMISSHEKTLLMEGLVIITKSLADYNRCDRFYRELLTCVSETLTEERLKSALEDPEKFVSYLGMDKPPISDESILKDHRKLITSVNMILAVVRRCSLSPAEETPKVEGNSLFINTAHVKNSWIPYVIALLPSVFQIIRQLSLIFSLPVRLKICKEYLPALDLHESERYYLLGQNTSSNPKDNDISEESDTNSRTRFHLFTLHEGTYRILGFCGASLGEIFYSTEGLTELIINHVTSTWKYLPKYRLRIVYRIFLKFFVQHCPQKYYNSVLGPVLGNVMEFMFQHLSEEWDKYYHRQAESKSVKEDNEDVETQEVVEDKLLFCLIRDYIEVIVHLLKTTKTHPGEGQGVVTESPDGELGEIGKFMLQFEGTNRPLVFTLFTILTWPDTTSVYRILKVIPLVVQQIFNFAPEVTIPESIVEYLFLQVIKGMQCHGSNADATAQGGLVTIALLMYTTLKMHYQTIVNILSMIPSCSKGKLRQFDLDVLSGGKMMTEKKKRELFKQLLVGVVGKNVSELYKTDIKIEDLPPLKPRRKPKPSEFAAEEATTEEAIVEEAIAEETIADEAIADEAIADEAIADEAIADEAIADEAIADEAIADEAIAEEAIAEEAIVEEDIVE